MVLVNPETRLVLNFLRVQYLLEALAVQDLQIVLDSQLVRLCQVLRQIQLDLPGQVIRADLKQK